MALAAVLPDAPGRVLRTVEMVERRGYALAPEALGRLCLGGPLEATEVLAAVAARRDLEVRAGLVVRRGASIRVEAVNERARAHRAAAPPYLSSALRFARLLAAAAPFVVSVSIAGSLASGGFRDSDDVDLNLVVEDGYRHLAYVLLNVLAAGHALRHRGKPVDVHTRRPLVPRLMTANLILERSDWKPLRRVDADMAFELLLQEPVVGADTLAACVKDNPELFEHFPQLATRTPRWSVPGGSKLPPGLYPRALEKPAAWTGELAWRAMMWTRRDRPEALERVRLVRATMRPYALFDRT